MCAPPPRCPLPYLTMSPRIGHDRVMQACARFLVALWCGFVLLEAAHADGAAGIVLYHVDDDGEIHLLLADHASDRRGWAAFGGGPEGDESPAETAARETEEETRGAYTRQSLLAKIVDQKPVSSKGFSLFFAQVPKIPVDEISKKKIPEGNKAYLERKCFAWVRWTTIEPLLAETTQAKNKANLPVSVLPASSNATYLWNVWVGNLKDAAKVGAIPWLVEPRSTKQGQ